MNHEGHKDHEGVSARRQVTLPIVYDGVSLDAGYRLDLLVAESIIVEIKRLRR